MKKKVYFYRTYKAFSGGHLKMWDYFNHVKLSPAHEPYIYFTGDSTLDPRNPWLSEEPLAEWRIEKADMIFLGGMDWTGLSEEQRADPPIPILNLIQHVRHADPSDPRYQFLKYKAIRICYSGEIVGALRETGQANGPILFVPMGIDHSLLPQPREVDDRPIDLLIIGLKRPRLARKLKWRLSIGQAFTPRPQKIQIRLLTTPIPRGEFLEAINQAKVTLFLPNRTEGFYIPALEGMALKTLVVCPDCVGNRSFCLPGHNCFRPANNEQETLQAVQKALTLPPVIYHDLLASARRTAIGFTLKKERESFLEILNQVDQLW